MREKKKRSMSANEVEQVDDDDDNYDDDYDDDDYDINDTIAMTNDIHANELCIMSNDDDDDDYGKR